MRFRLITLFALVTIFSVLIAAIASHRRAWEEISRLDTEIQSAMLDVHPHIAKSLLHEFENLAKKNPTYAKYMAENSYPLMNPNWSLTQFSYSDGGNGYGSARGGLIDGPHSIERNIIINTADPMDDFSKMSITGSLEKVNVVIETRASWRFFAGTPEVIITDRGTPANRQYIQLMTDALSRRGIACKIEK